MPFLQPPLQVLSPPCEPQVLFHLFSERNCLNMEQKMRRHCKLAFQILRFTWRALSRIWSDMYLHCWRRRCSSLSALLIQRHALEISPCARLLLQAPPASTLPLLKVTIAAAHRAPAPRVRKARMQHEMGFIREQFHLLAYLNTRSMLGNCVKRLSMCAESSLISSCLAPHKQALSE